MRIDFEFTTNGMTEHQAEQLARFIEATAHAFYETETTVETTYYKD